MMVLVGILI